MPKRLQSPWPWFVVSLACFGVTVWTWNNPPSENGQAVLDQLAVEEDWHLFTEQSRSITNKKTGLRITPGNRWCFVWDKDHNLVTDRFTYSDLVHINRRADAIWKPLHEASQRKVTEKLEESFNETIKRKP